MAAADVVEACPFDSVGAASATALHPPRRRPVTRAAFERCEAPDFEAQ